jgi:hypothetical protein
MQTIVRPIAEILFTSYLLPALALPAVWSAGALARRRGAGTAVADPRPLMSLHAGIALALIAGWALGASRVPIERGGAPLTIAAWLAFALLHFSYAAVATGVTARVSAAPDERERDAWFAAFIGLTLLQPIGTAAGLAVLYRLMRLVYHQSLPLLDVVPEGI